MKTNNLTEEQKQFIKRVAEDSINMTINVEEIKTAYELLTDESANIKKMRKELYDYYNRPQIDNLPDYMNPDFDIEKELPTETDNTKIEETIEKELKTENSNTKIEETIEKELKTETDNSKIEETIEQELPTENSNTNQNKPKGRPRLK
jgi:hypothetical protein